MTSSLLSKRPPPKRQRERPATTSDAPRPDSTTVRRRYARWGRWTLWTILAWLFVVIGINGVATIIGGERSVVRQSTTQPFPGDEARAFAAEFATTFLTFSPGESDAQVAALTPMLARSLRADDIVDVGERGRSQRAAQTWIARTERVGQREALVTVAARVAHRGKVTTRYLTVPIAEDRAGGLVVSDYPSLTSPPRAAAPPPADERALQGPDAAAIEALLKRFLGQYLQGGPVAPEFLAPGASIVKLGVRYELEDLVSVVQDGPGTPRHRRVLAVVEARDTASGAVYTLRYRVEVTRRDRWLVNRIEG